MKTLGAAATSTCAVAAASLAPCTAPRAQQRLRRNARPVGALAADELALDKCDTQTALGERAGAVLTWRAAADNDDVVVAHVGSSLPACSATMYSAYQLGQSASR